jgi:MoxR-like ATPase
MTIGTTLQPKFAELRTALDTELVERADVIDTMILALLSKTHHFQLGSPGVAKSYSIRKLESHIGGFGPDDSFEILLTRFSSMEDVWGPFDLRELEQGKYIRITKGMLPLAKFGFLDEIFKCSSSLLNSFLWALNERQYRENGSTIDIPLWTMFCASNELPESEELNALYDRIHFRVVTKPIQEASAFVRMLSDRKQDLLQITDKKILSWQEIEDAYEEVAQVVIPNDVLDALNAVRNSLSAEGILPTDRRFAESLRIIRASAWLDGQSVADVEHLRPLAHVMWDSVDHIPKVQRLLFELANPLDKRALELLETVEDMQITLEKLIREDMDAQVKSKRGVELHNRVDRATRELKDLSAEVAASGRRSAKTDEVKTKLMKVTRLLLKELFSIDMKEETP